METKYVDKDLGTIFDENSDCFSPQPYGLKLPAMSRSAFIEIVSGMLAEKQHLPVSRFDHSPEGYLKAKQWLEHIDEWERVSTTGFSTDGWSIVATANSIWNKRLKEL